jgi:tetratricopeptide (TPR) repeat protein
VVAALFAALAGQQASFDDLTARAQSARDIGRLDDALALYRKAVELQPSWDEGRWYIATILYEIDRYSEARDAFAEVLRRQPTHAGAAGLKGLCEFQLRRFDQALIDLLQAREMGVSRSATMPRFCSRAVASSSLRTRC